MKKLGKILYYVLAGGVALFAVGYLVYEIVWKDILDMTNIIRTLLIVATMILAIWRVATGNGRGRKKHSEQFFRENYGAMIGNAFIAPGKAKKGLINAHRTYKHSYNNVKDEYLRGCKTGFVYKNLSDGAKKTAHKKCKKRFYKHIFINPLM